MSTLVGTPNLPISHFGSDGLGDVLEDSQPDVWRMQIQREHAVNALIRMVSENEGQVSTTARLPVSPVLTACLSPSSGQAVLVQ